MSIEENKTVLRRYIEEVVNQGHLDRIPQFVAPSYVEEKRQNEIAVHRILPDMHMVVEQMAAEGDLVMKRDTITGTPQEEVMGFAPTGQKLTFTEITVDRFVDGKIVQNWAESDVLQVLQKAAAQKKVR
jgi:predicted ester cyclase